MSEVFYLPQTDSTNLWAKAHPDRAAGVWAVYTLDQTAGRGRLGRGWADAAGQALYYTAVLPYPPAGMGTLPLLASLLVREVLDRRYGVGARLGVKWPNDVLLDGKKLVGILCEAVPGREMTVCGIGINLAQPQRFFDAAGLPHAASLALAGVDADAARDAGPLARALTDAFAAAAPRLRAEGFAPRRAAYEAACVNLGRRVRWESGEGTAVGIDETGRLVVRANDGVRHVFTGEVSVQGIYGSL